ncbi:MAG: hypothetical protein ACRDCE_15215, partial [Cetobacterium sp.]|uniref:hypothetical protein n=1 Tax=Cetobacterium sp. TaxID=2071632 RepID=UPI003EE5D6B1
ALNQSSEAVPHWSVMKGIRARDRHSSNSVDTPLRRALSFTYAVCGSPTWSDGGSSLIRAHIRQEATRLGITVNKHVYNLMVELFDDIPYYRDMVSFTYVDTDAFCAVNMHFDIDESTPADKVITAAFLARNLTQNAEWETYRHLRETYKPHFCAIIASIMQCRPDNGVNPFGAGGAPRGVASFNGLGEYNWVTPRGIGREGVMQLLTGEEPEWSLPGWISINGYRRESWYQQNNMRINNRNQNLVDWATIPGDHEHFLSEAFWQQSGGMFTPRQQMTYNTCVNDIRRFASELQDQYSINVFN